MFGATRCAAYLIGAGSDITFDIEFAMATKCNVYTIDPTPGLAQRLESRSGIASMVLKRPKLAKEIIQGGPPPNWRHVNVGVNGADTTVHWGTGAGWASSHAKWLKAVFNVTHVDTTVRLKSIPSLMRSLGHSSIQLIKIDAEGAEWQLLNDLITRTKLSQLMLEMHGITADKLFAAYELMMRNGFTLMYKYRYWREPTAEEKAAGDKRNRIGVLIWCEGEVVLVANGTTTLEKPENVTCKKLADAGAVRIRWPADPARKEPETRSWYILQDAKWANGRSKDAHLSWRFTAGELQKRADDAAAAREVERAAKKQKQAAPAGRWPTREL